MSARGEQRRLQLRSQGSQRRALAWARRAGFTERQAPWAAVIASSLKTGRKGAPVFAADVQPLLSAQHPHLFENPVQGRLWDDAAF